MTITRVQGNKRAYTWDVGTTTCSLTSTPTVGNVIIACILSNGSPVTGVTQTNVVWGLVKQGQQLYGNPYVEIWLGVVSANASEDIVVTGATDWLIVDACEYSGILTSGYTDKTANNNGDSVNTTDTGTTATTTQAAELWIGATVTYSNQAQTTPTNGFTLLDGATIVSSPSIAYLEKIVSAIGTANSGTIMANNDYWGGCIATFKAVTSSPVSASGSVGVGSVMSESVTALTSVGVSESIGIGNVATETPTGLTVVSVAKSIGVGYVATEVATALTSVAASFSIGVGYSGSEVATSLSSVPATGAIGIASVYSEVINALSSIPVSYTIGISNVGSSSSTGLVSVAANVSIGIGESSIMTISALGVVSASGSIGIAAEGTSSVVSLFITVTYGSAIINRGFYFGFP